MFGLTFASRILSENIKSESYYFRNVQFLKHLTTNCNLSQTSFVRNVFIIKYFDRKQNQKRIISERYKLQNVIYQKGNFSKT